MIARFRELTRESGHANFFRVIETRSRRKRRCSRATLPVEFFRHIVV